MKKIQVNKKPCTVEQRNESKRRNKRKNKSLEDVLDFVEELERRISVLEKRGAPIK